MKKFYVILLVGCLTIGILGCQEPKEKTKGQNGGETVGTEQGSECG